MQQKRKEKKKAYPWKAGTSRGHTTNLKKSILETIDIYGHGTAIPQNMKPPKLFLSILIDILFVLFIKFSGVLCNGHFINPRHFQFSPMLYLLLP
jgi:hypothetical protein